MKNILVISAGPFSKTDNDGLTLENLFQNYSKDHLAQFFIQDMEPDFNFCYKYYNRTDKDVIKSFWKKAQSGVLLDKSEQQTNIANNGKVSSYKNPLTMVLRNILWKISPWKGKHFQEWIFDFNPDLIFFKIGDNAYLMDLVVKIKKQLDIPLILYNTEGYYFFKKNYIKNSPRWTTLFYPFLHKQIRHSFARIMNAAELTIYSCEKLEFDYNKVFKGESVVIYNTFNSLAIKRNQSPKHKLKISYLGSLGYHRPLALLDIANMLKEIAPDIIIDVFGMSKNIEELELLKSHENIQFHGVISYDDVLNVISSTDILLHVESPLSMDEVKYGFSTKIPDSLASGNCFFVYSPICVAGTEYIYNNIPEIVATSRTELKEKLNKLLINREYREMIKEKCLKLAYKYHSKEKNIRVLMDILDNIKIK